MNIINAIINLINNPIIKLVDDYKGRNRANNVGDALEEYVKDLFADSFDLSDSDRLERVSEVFSYLGNDSNPPDIMLKNGDAIEVKKIESDGAALALNSSYPKQKLFANSPMINKACKKAENWTEKDMIYVVGVVNKKTNELKYLCMVYGLDYCAVDECYSRIKKTIKTGVESIQGIEFAESKELGHINKVDPLGITYMRVRGMWGIANPWKVFDYVYQRDKTKNFNFMCIINDVKWNTFDNKSELEQIASDNANVVIKNVKIKNPDNPAKLNDAKLISFSL